MPVLVRIMSVAAYDKDFKEGRVIKTVKDLEAAKFIKAFAEHLKRQGKFELPKWNDVVKTGVSKELAPYDPDWLYTRAASIIRKVYIRAGCGVGGFAKVYGGQYRRGTQTNTWSRGSRKVIRYCLIQMKAIGLIEDLEDGGVRITQEGQRELDTVACQVGKTEAEAAEEEEDGEADGDDQ